MDDIIVGKCSTAILSGEYHTEALKQWLLTTSRSVNWIFSLPLYRVGSWSLRASDPLHLQAAF